MKIYRLLKLENFLSRPPINSFLTTTLIHHSIFASQISLEKIFRKVIKNHFPRASSMADEKERARGVDIT